MNSGEPEYPHMSMQQQVLKDKKLQMVFWQSDQYIVSVKQSNVCGEKVLARMRRDVRDTSSTLRGGAKMSTKLTSITQRARGNPKDKFTSLVHLLTEDFLQMKEINLWLKGVRNLVRLE